MATTKGGFTYPNNYELVELQARYMEQSLDSYLGLSLFPDRTTDKAEIVMHRPDFIGGVQGWRGLGKNMPTTDIGYNPFGEYCTVQPGYWGESTKLDEVMLTKAGDPSACGAAIDITEMTGDIARGMLQRRYARKELSVWQALIYGGYTAMSISNQIVGSFRYPINRSSVAIPWSNKEYSTPLKDLRCLLLKGRGSIANFGSCTRFYMNQVTANALMSNQNAMDIGKTAVSACCDYVGMDTINGQLAAQGLGQVAVYDNTYYDNKKQLQLYIPDGKVVAIGCLPNGENIGRYFLTRNLLNCGTGQAVSSPVMMIKDNCGTGDSREIKIMDGHNGGVGLQYPEAVCTIDVGNISNDC